MRILTVISAVLAVSLSIDVRAASAENPVDPPVLTGQLARKDIAFQFLSERDREFTHGMTSSRVEAQYFYRSIGRIIPLVKAEDGWLAECKADFRSVDCTEPTGYWRVPDAAALPGGPSFQAQWRATSSGPISEVTLVPTPESTDGKLRKWARLLGTGTTKLERRLQRNQVVAGVLTDVRSGAKVPQLISGYPAEVMTRFNGTQREQLVKHAASRLENQSLGGDEDDSERIQYQSPRWLVWGGGGGGYYGGAHPLYAFGFEAYDLTIGAKVNTRTALFHHLTNSELQKLGDKYGSATLAGKQLQKRRVIESLVLKEILKEQGKLPNSAKQGDMAGDECFEIWREQFLTGEDDDPGQLTARSGRYTSDGNFTFSFELMPQFGGLAVVTNDFAEAGRGCRGVMFTIPWSKVRPYLKQPL